MLESLLSQALQENHLSLDPVIQKKMITYLELMISWNRVFNLTTITEPKEMVYLHLIDSLLVSPFLHGKQMLDVGSGAGLPGIPLAILHPDQHWTLIDKNNKKTRFITQAIAELNLTNVTAIHARSEDFHPAQCFDTIISRAFGTLALFVETTSNLLCPAGKWIAMKGKYPRDEIHDISTPIAVEKVERVEMNGINIDRHVVIMKKE